MKKYKLLENVAIADIAYEAYGRSLNELFENAAFAVFEMMADLNTVGSPQKIEFELENEKIDSLLFDFLSEILFLKDSKYTVFKKVKVEISENGKYRLKAVLEGETIDRQKHKLENDIKAVTMHMFEVKKEKSGYKATVVVDV